MHVIPCRGPLGIKLHYTAQLTIQPVRGFENGGHYIPAAESALPAVEICLHSCSVTYIYTFIRGVSGLHTH